MKVYRFWAEPKTDADRELLRDQLAVASIYRRDLAHIENRARRLTRAVLALPKEQRTAYRAMIFAAQEVATKDARKRARDAGCAWGTCAQVAEAIDQSRRTTKIYDDIDTFARRDEGLLAVQYQRNEGRHVGPHRLPKSKGGGICHIEGSHVHNPSWRPVLASSLIGGDDTFVRISADLVGRPTLRTRRSGAESGAAHLRVLSYRTGSVGRAPIWAQLYVAMDGHGRGARARERGLHPLPDARVVWVCLSCRMVGLRARWELLVTADEECAGTADAERAERAECVGVDIGWRRVSGGVRTAYWAGSDGESGELVIPDEVIDRKAKSDSLLSIRDRERDEVAAQWRAWIATIPVDHPVRVEASARAMHAWRRVGRYVLLHRMWSQHRIAGDEDVFERVGRWLQHDRHLLAWQANNRRRLTYQTSDLVDQLMVRLARRYRIVAVEGRGMVPELIRRGSAGDDHALETARKRIGVVAPASVRQAAEQWSRKYGAIFREVDPAGTTSCPCGGDLIGDRADLVLRCGTCGVTDDQDRAAAITIQRIASGEVRRETAEALAAKSSSATPRKMPPRRTRRRADPGLLESDASNVENS